MKKLRTFGLIAAAVISFHTAQGAGMGEKFAIPDVLAVVQINRVDTQPEAIGLTTKRVLKGQLQQSLQFSFGEWGDDIPPVGTYVFVRLKREGDRLIVMDRELHAILAAEHVPSDDALPLQTKIAHELTASLEAIEASDQDQEVKAWRRTELINDLVSLGDSGIGELQRLHSISSGSLRLAFLAGMLRAGDASAVEMDMPLLLTPPRLTEVEEAFISGCFGSSQRVSASQAARLLKSISPRIREQAAYVLQRLATTKTSSFDSPVLESIVRTGLTDSNWQIRYYSVSTLAEITKLQPVNSVDIFRAGEKDYVDFWKAWARRGGIESFLKSTAASAPSAARALGAAASR